MNKHTPQLALREWTADLARRETIAVLLGLSVVMGLAGPFGTDDALRFVPRLIYWTITVFATYSVGNITSGLVRAAMPDGTNRWSLIGVTGTAIGAAVSVTVVAINAAAFAIWPDRETIVPFLVSVFGIALVIATVFDVISRSAPGTVQPPALLDRLPFDKRGSLVALSVEDHYVRVRTINGEEMILMRLGDAIRETGHTKGLQVHRSHWVAQSAITKVTRSGDRAALQMSHGPDIPVSRANMPKLKEAGLLPA